jgi:hypothetical protein
LFTKRFPQSGHYGGSNILDLAQKGGKLDFVITPNDISRVIRFKVEVHDADDAPFGGSDDHLGTLNYDLSVMNAWGMKDRGGRLETGAFQKINNISWSVQPVVDISSLTDEEKWWGVGNEPTGTISYEQYASAFRDVDSEPEWWDIPDWLRKAFYELVVKGIAENGNCFGMSLEAIYSRKSRSSFGMPLNRFQTWSDAVNVFNIRQQYQVGAPAIWWFVGQFLSGNTHHPVDVFNETRNRFERGEHPVLNIAQRYNFRGAPHAMLPVGWDTSAKPWILQVCDPNFPGAVRSLEVDPDENTFSYDGGADKFYSGGRWLGGRMHYMPYTVLNARPRTPVWAAIELIIDGKILILGADSETVSLTDDAGVDLDAFGEDAISRLQQGQPLDNKYVPIGGFDHGLHQVIGSSVYLSRQTNASSDQESVFRKNINHTFRGLRDGELKYVLKDKLNQFMLTSTINANEVNRIDVHDTGSSSTVLKVTSELSKMVKLEVENQLGAGRDRVKVTIDALPAGGGNDLQVSMNPGLGSLDIYTTSAATLSNLTISMSIYGTEIQRTFDLNVEGGLRIYPSTILASGELEVNRIDDVFGEATSSFLLRAR